MTDVKLIEWIKPNKNTIKTNNLPATVAYAEKLGWKRKDAPPKDAPPK
jgi:hypothetical protein